MTSPKQTSRTNILDMIELIANLIAGSSHIQEKLVDLRKQNSLMEEQEITQEIGILQDMDKSLLALRRDVMTEMLRQADSESDDNHYWCLAKHLFASYGYAGELIQSDYDNDFFKRMYDEVFDLLLKGLYLFLKLEEIPTCSRCLADKLKNIK